MILVGATNAALDVAPALPSDCGAIYAVKVSNPLGEVMSPPATLTVLPAQGAPVVDRDPERARTTVGGVATFSVEATSATPMRYQWQKGGFLGNMADIPGATDATYTTPPAALNEHHTLFRCVVSNAAGSTVSASEMLFVTEK